MWPVRGREIAQEDPRHAKEQDEIRNAVQDDEERLQAEVEAFEKRRRPAPPPARRRRLSYSSITEAEAVRVLSENADAARVSFVEERLRADATQEAEVLMASFHAHEEEEQVIVFSMPSQRMGQKKWYDISTPEYQMEYPMEYLIWSMRHHAPI